MHFRSRWGKAEVGWREGEFSSLLRIAIIAFTLAWHGWMMGCARPRPVAYSRLALPAAAQVVRMGKVLMTVMLFLRAQLACGVMVCLWSSPARCPQCHNRHDFLFRRRF